MARSIFEFVVVTQLVHDRIQNNEAGYPFHTTTIEAE